MSRETLRVFFGLRSLISGLAEGLGMSHDIFPCECRLRSEINSFRILKFNGQLINFHCWNFRGHVAIHYIRYSLFLGTLETDLPKGVVNPGWFKYGMKTAQKQLSREWLGNQTHLQSQGCAKTKYGLKQLSSFHAFCRRNSVHTVISCYIYIHWSPALPSQKFTNTKTICKAHLTQL